MAKATEKAAVKKAAPKKRPAAKKSPTSDPGKAATTALGKLKELNLDKQLQADIEWCLGSYKFDKNPVGLREMIGRAVKVLTLEKSKKTKGVTGKFITDLEKVLTS